MERLFSANMGIPLILNAFAILIIKMKLTEVYNRSDGLVHGLYLSNRVKMILFHPPLTKKIKDMFIPKHTVILVSTMHLSIVLIAVSYILWDTSEIFSVHGRILPIIMGAAFFLELILISGDTAGYHYNKEKPRKKK